VLPQAIPPGWSAIRKLSPDGLGIALGTVGVELTALAKHGLFHLLGDYRADLAEVLPDGVDLDCGAHQEFEIAFQVARLGGGSGGRPWRPALSSSSFS
jgi:hypothetical protein